MGRLSGGASDHGASTSASDLGEQGHGLAPARGLAPAQREYPGLGPSREGLLPQGAPTSGAISNLVMRDAEDDALYAVASRLGLRYTRYSDDLYFSARSDVPSDCGEPADLLRTQPYFPSRTFT